jgi:hypothetical protein
LKILLIKLPKNGQKGEKYAEEIKCKEYNYKQMLLFPASIGDFLPDDHIVHVG